MSYMKQQSHNGIQGRLLFICFVVFMNLLFQDDTLPNLLSGQLFGFREIADMANLNGHLSTYWDTNFYNYYAKIDYGKYLAGDIGSTLTLTRRFSNGWDFGGFFTLTDASFADFGEGSFDKGFFFKIPFNAAVPFENNYSFVERIRPIQGDGGAQVNIAGRLFEQIEPFRKSNLIKSWPRLWR